MENISDRVNRLSESATIAMARKARELKSQGIDIISLSLGEPDFNTPDFIKEAAKEGIDQNYSKYMPVNGYQDLREAISNKFKRDNNIDYTTDQIVVSTGAKQSIANVVLSLINPGDEVIVPAPYWVSYEEIIKMAEGIPVFIETSIENDFKISPQQLENAISSKTKMMIYSSPCNPSGSVYSKEELLKLRDIVKKHDLFLFADEVYREFTYDGNTHYSIMQEEGLNEYAIIIDSVSKRYSMCGARIVVWFLKTNRLYKQR